MSRGCSTQQVSETARPAPYFDRNGITLYCGSAETVLPHLPRQSIDCLITDPPYCSGGATAAERSADPVTKYCHSGNALGKPSFSGDSRDQRSFVRWCTDWLRDARPLLKPSAYVLVFSDWRQLPTMTDVLQCAGLHWRGLIAWDKGRGARAPHKGFVKHQCEYVIWGTEGRVRKRLDAGPFDGCLHHAVRVKDKHHITGKPTPLMRDLVQLCPAGETVLDLFAGSGTTGVAALQTGRKAILIEQSEEYCEIAARRLDRGE